MNRFLSLSIVAMLLLVNFVLGYRLVQEPPKPDMLPLHAEIHLNVLDASSGQFRQRLGCIDGYIVWSYPDREPEYYVSLCDENPIVSYFIMNQETIGHYQPA